MGLSRKGLLLEQPPVRVVARRDIDFFILHLFIKIIVEFQQTYT